MYLFEKEDDFGYSPNTQLFLPVPKQNTSRQKFKKWKMNRFFAITSSKLVGN